MAFIEQIKKNWKKRNKIERIATVIQWMVSIVAIIICILFWFLKVELLLEFAQLLLAVILFIQAVIYWRSDRLISIGSIAVGVFVIVSRLITILV